MKWFLIFSGEIYDDNSRIVSHVTHAPDNIYMFLWARKINVFDMYIVLSLHSADHLESIL